MIITLSHQKGGVGKSTIAWNLAVHFSNILPTKIIDLDTQQSLTQTNQIRIAEGMPSLDFKQINNAGELALYIDNDTDEKLTIIDSGGFDSTLNRVAIVSSDLLMTPVSDKPFDLMGLQKYNEILKSLSKIQNETLKTYIIFNNLNPSLKNYGDIIDFVCSSDNFNLLTSVLRQRVDIANSIGVGKSIKEYRVFSKADQEFDSLFSEVKQILGIL